MGYEIPILEVGTLAAGADLSAKQFFLVKISAGAINLASTDEQAFGVLQNAPVSGDAASVTVLGVSKVVYGGSVTAGDKLAANSLGKAVLATAAHVSAGTPEPLTGSHVIGIALEDGASGDVGTIALIHAGLTN